MASGVINELVAIRNTSYITSEGAQRSKTVMLAKREGKHGI